MPLFPDTWGGVYFLPRPTAGGALPAFPPEGLGLGPPTPGVCHCGNSDVGCCPPAGGGSPNLRPPVLGVGWGDLTPRAGLGPPPSSPSGLAPPFPNPRIRPKSLGLSELQLRNVSPRADRCTAGTGRKATSAYMEGLKDFIPLTQTLPPPSQAVDSLLGTMSDQGLDSTWAGYLRLTTSKIY